MRFGLPVAAWLQCWCWASQGRVCEGGHLEPCIDRYARALHRTSAHLLLDGDPCGGQATFSAGITSGAHGRPSQELTTLVKRSACRVLSGLDEAES
jgi:hypothetical protein